MYLGGTLNNEPHPHEEHFICCDGPCTYGGGSRTDASNNYYPCHLGFFWRCHPPPEVPAPPINMNTTALYKHTHTNRIKSNSWQYTRVHCNTYQYVNVRASCESPSDFKCVAKSSAIPKNANDASVTLTGSFWQHWFVWDLSLEMFRLEL